MADVIDYRIIGSELQMVEIELDQGEGVRAEAGALVYMEAGIEMETGTGGGIFAGFKRAISGAGFFITTFVSNRPGKAHVAFAKPHIGQILPIDLTRHGGELLVQRDGFLCAAAGIEIDVAFTKRFGAGLFGGEGFVLQRLHGDGMAFVHGGGAVVERELAQGEVLLVDAGCLLGFEGSVDFDVTMMKGITNAIFGGDGLFLAHLTGPGRVYLQGLPFSRLVDSIAHHMPKKS